MVRGLDRFREHFKGLEDRYVLIGGTACDLAFDAAGVPFRATKDLDIVLCVESLDAEFAKAFWGFVRLGGYELQESSTGEKRLYRFKKPKSEDFPAMLELFARVPDALGAVSGDLTPIPIDEDVSSLSAILLDPAYYEWIQSGKHVLGLDPFPWTPRSARMLARSDPWTSPKASAGSGVCSPAISSPRRLASARSATGPSPRWRRTLT